ncbi:MAG: hypothetical protein KME60_13100 [Cyanomargarita calcarea GSE-NOS-MK-12-04C]|uniref:DNA recombination protein RmuC n=1 Tax=Cyanomargarita calcarea GSE-NOS-MK-12-04C TaxID=2839659 RepID=A0A951QLQ9_9CYAN|nr:hypothetical protein [Cyanomargarita calcarea GSE-NOS-MK-12-04C]
MNIAILVVSSVSTALILVIMLFVILININLRNQKTQQEKILRFLEEANEISKDIKRIAFEDNKQQPEVPGSFQKQLDSLILEIQNIKNNLNELLQSNGQTNENFYTLIQETQKVENTLNELLQSNIKESQSLYILLSGNTNMQLEKLQETFDEIKGLKASLEDSAKS